MIATMSQHLLRYINTFSNLISLVVILTLVVMLIRSKNQMARVMDKLSDALASQVRPEHPSNVSTLHRPSQDR